MVKSLSHYQSREALRKSKYCRLQSIMRQLRQEGIDAKYDRNEITVFGDAGGTIYFSNRREPDGSFSADLQIESNLQQFSGDTLEEGLRYVIDNNKISLHAMTQ